MERGANLPRPQFIPCTCLLSLFSSFEFWAKPRGAQGLVLTPSSGRSEITPWQWLVTLWDVRDRVRVRRVQVMHSSCCLILCPRSVFFLVCLFCFICFCWLVFLLSCCLQPHLPYFWGVTPHGAPGTMRVRGQIQETFTLFVPLFLFGLGSPSFLFVC